ncbi:MAG TPA: ABC transporter substrate-binding protein [Planctomycetaceae bacterium]|nr:ABC transporter substrate-binding protein [Planctomycetaceae bacterium]
MRTLPTNAGRKQNATIVVVSRDVGALRRHIGFDRIPWRHLVALGIIWLTGLWTAPAIAIAQPPKKKAAADAEKSDQAAESETAAPEAPSDEETAELPKIDKMELPSFQRLMEGPALDWIVLTNQTVLEVEPLFPRPGTLDDLNARIKQAMRKPGQPAETEADRRKRLAMFNLPVTLLEGEDREYKLHTKFIKEIIYYEDLMLRRIDKLLDDKQVRQAYELLVALEQRQADWPGIVHRRERVMFTEAEVQLASQRPQQALALLETLHEKAPTYPGLDDQFGACVDRLISDALQQKDYRQARFFLKRLARRIPGHRLVPLWTNRLTQQTRDLVARAVAAEREGGIDGALDLAEEAARTWPELSDVLPVFNRLSNRLQRLRVGVVDLPQAESAVETVVLTPAERRCRQLTEIHLFQPARVIDKITRYETRFFQDWEPAELGHSVVFRLQPFRMRGASQPVVTSAGLLEALADRLDPVEGRYDARFAAAVAGLTVRGPFEIAVQFRQVPLRPEALFAFPLQRTAALSSSAAEAESPAGAGGPGPTFPFELRNAGDPARAIYRRTVPDAEAATDRNVTEVIERRYDSYELAIQGLLRGEVSLLPRVPPSTVRNFSTRNEYFTQPYGLPVTHMLQFHPQSRPLKSRALRRGLIYGLDRGRLLEELFLHEPQGTLGRLTTAPWPSTIYAYNRFITPHNYDPALAYSLTKTAEKELGGALAPLRMWTPDDPEVRGAAGRIVESWKAIGVHVTLISPATGAASPGINSADWDIAYRVELVAEPLIELWSLLALTASTETSTLNYLPTWLRHDLLELDRIGDWRSAEDLLHKLHRQLWAEVHLIPLWELDEHFVVRKNIRNVPDRPLFPYQGIERWKVEPWFSRD